MRAICNRRRSGCHASNGKESAEMLVGWHKGWIVENAYGWHFVGPVEKWPIFGPYANLVVLNHEPTLPERQQIEARFADALAPDGTLGWANTLDGMPSRSKRE